MDGFPKLAMLVKAHTAVGVPTGGESTSNRDYGRCLLTGVTSGDAKLT